MSETAPATTEAPAAALPAGDPGNALATAAPAEAVAPKEGEQAAEPKVEEAERVGAPEAYEFTPPEGQELNAEQFTEWQAKAKDAGLTQGQFAKLTTEAIGMVNAINAKNADAWHATQREWQAGIAADPEIAGQTPGTLNDGAREAASRVITAYGGDALKQALIITGAGNHPAVVRAFVAIGKAMGEESNIAGGLNKPAATDTLARLYPSMA